MSDVSLGKIGQGVRKGIVFTCMCVARIKT